MTRIAEERALYEIAEGLHERLSPVSNGLIRSDFEHCLRLAPEIFAIQNLKTTRDAAILAHSYAHPEILYTVADVVGDSLKLAEEAGKLKQKTLIYAAVRFMAETAKILNPEKKVISANPSGGCSLAESIDANTVRRLRREFPSHAFVCYVNTTADVKAECDVCVTSSNAAHIIAAMPSNKIFFLPDRLMGQNLASYCRGNGISKELLVWEGTCYVHERYEHSQIAYWRERYPDLFVLAHPECPSSVCQAADFVGSTGAMMDEVRRSQRRHYLVLTECGLVSRLQAEVSEEKIFVGSCSMCRYMKSNSLSHLKRALESPVPEWEVQLDPMTSRRAHDCVKRMFIYGKSALGPHS